MRAYAAERLAERPGHRDDAVARHRAFCLAHGERLLDRIDGRDGPEALDQLGAEADNLLAAFDGATTAQELARLARILDELLRVRGPATLHKAILDRALDAQPPDELRAQLLIDRARVLRQTGKPERAARDVDAAAALASTAPLRGEVALARGLLAEAGGRLDDGLGRYRQAEGEFDDAEQPFGRLKARSLRAFALWQLGRRAEAEPLLRDALVEVERLGAQAQAAKLLSTLGLALGERGCWEEALEVMEQAQAGHAERGDRRSEGIVLGNIANLHSYQGRHERAEHF